MKILILVPTSPFAPHWWKQAAQSVFAAQMAYGGGPVDLLVRAHDNPNEDHPYLNIVGHHNYARDIVLQNGYDAMLSIEADMVVPEDTIQRLVDTDADVAYGLYVWRHGRKRWSAYTELDLWGGTSLSTDKEAAASAWGGVIDVAGVGMGCTLIRRHVLEEIDFHLFDGLNGWMYEQYVGDFERLGIDPDRPRDGMLADDWYFAMDAQRHGFSQKCDTGLVCAHLTYKPWPQAIWPDPDQPRLYRIDTMPGVTWEQRETVEVHVGMDQEIDVMGKVL